MGKAIGIDLGTVNSCVAVIENGTPVVLPDEEGRRTTPSVYALSAIGEPIVGHAARVQQEQNRLNTIFAIKRLIGLKFDSEEVAAARKRLPYAIVAAKNNDAWVEVNGLPKSPEEVSAHVLARMREIAEHSLHERIHHAVITVPAHFNDAQRQATKDAAKIAGLDVLRVINEPTSAALAYGLANAEGELHRKRVSGAVVDRLVAVFDLGGGTFDVSILALRDGVFDVLSTHGDSFLGGEDFDLAIMDFVLHEFRRTTGEDLSQNRAILQKLKLAVTEAKHRLSSEPAAPISIPYATAAHHLELVLERKIMEKVVQPLLKRLEGPCLQAMEDAKLEPDDIDEVILVGGMTRMQSVKKLCRQVFGKEPNDSVNPDEAVALGAAVQAGLLQGLLKGVSLRDVTSLSLGIEVQGGMMHTMIPRNTKIPVRVAEMFTTSAPNQPQVSIHVVQGEEGFAPDNRTLGRFELMGVAPAPRGEPDVEIALEVDTDGIVHVSAKDLRSGEEQSMEIVANSGLDEREIDSLLRESFVNEQQKARIAQHGAGDRVLGDDALAQAYQHLRSEIFMTQFRLDKEGSGFKGKPRETLESCLASARKVLELAVTPEELKNSLTALRTVVAVFDKFLDAA